MPATVSMISLRPRTPAPVNLEPLPMVRINAEIPLTPDGDSRRPAGVSDIPAIFETSSSILDGCRVLIAVINEGSLDGEAYVLYQRGRELFEVEAYHCSCYGFGGTWNPTRVPRKYLELKLGAAQKDREIRHARFGLQDPVSPLDTHIGALLEYWRHSAPDERPE